MRNHPRRFDLDHCLGCRVCGSRCRQPRQLHCRCPESRLEFVGVQAGAEFKGVFHKFTAAVDFAPDALATSRIDVQIDMNSVDSMDKDRDNTIRGKDVFDVAHNPRRTMSPRPSARPPQAFPRSAR